LETFQVEKTKTGFDYIHQSLIYLGSISAPKFL